MIRKRILFLIIFLVAADILPAQNPVPFYDREKNKWGFTDSINQKIIIDAQFDFAEGWWKDYGIVRIGGKYGLVNREGKKTSPFIHDYIFIMECEDCESKENLASEVIYYYRDHVGAITRPFFINENCDCIPQRYFPCPPMVNMDTSNTPENLRILQRAEYNYHQGEIRKALKWADKAIAADTNDASALFWKAMHISSQLEIGISENAVVMFHQNENRKTEWRKIYVNDSLYWKNRLTSTQSDRITEEIYRAEMRILNRENDSMLNIFRKRNSEIDSLEIYHNLWLEQGLDYINVKFDSSFNLNSLYNKIAEKTQSKSIYYSALSAKYELNYISKKEKKNISREIRKKVSYYDRKGEMSMMLSGGYGFFPYQKWEANLSFGLSQFMFKNYFPYFGQFGAGYEKSFESDFSAIKVFFMYQVLGPIHLGFHLLGVSNGENSGGGFRPEFGFSFSAISVLYGYNFVKESLFPGARGNMVAVRFYLPVWRKNEFRKDLGSNLFR